MQRSYRRASVYHGTLQAYKAPRTSLQLVIPHPHRQASDTTGDADVPPPALGSPSPGVATRILSAIQQVGWMIPVLVLAAISASALEWEEVHPAPRRSGRDQLMHGIGDGAERIPPEAGQEDPGGV
jgi:hypothetical protein